VEKYSTEKQEYYWVDMSTAPEYILPEWVEKYSEVHQTAYWVNNSTRKTTWQSPENDNDLDAFRKLADLIMSDGKKVHVSVSGRVRFSGIGLCLVAAHTWHGPESAEQDLQQSNQTGNPLHKDSSWEERHSEEHGRKYWVNMSTRETTWRKPQSAMEQLPHQSDPVLEQAEV
jgi:hypothetical protein